jgi:hypothetical protein
MLSLILVHYPSDFEDASKLNMEMTKPGPRVDQRQDDLKDISNVLKVFTLNRFFFWCSECGHNR